MMQRRTDHCAPILRNQESPCCLIRTGNTYVTRSNNRGLLIKLSLTRTGIVLFAHPEMSMISL